MLGELATRVLVLMLGYGYPAFECFKALEMREVEIRRFRFWLQYWTIVGIVTVFERFGDFIISWLPMYGEAKLAFFIYLWHPKTQGTIMVYEAFLRPLVVRHEPDIEERLRCFRARSADMLLFYIKNFTERGQSFFLDLLHYVISRSPGSSNKEEIKRPEPSAPPYAIMFGRPAQPGPTTEAGAYLDEPNDYMMDSSTEDPRRSRHQPKNRKKQ